MYSAGVAVNWRAVQGHRRKVVSLPTYPFQRQRCWFRSGVRGNDNVSIPASQPRIVEGAATKDSSQFSEQLIGVELDVAGRSRVFETQLASFPELADHRVLGASVFPAAGYIELMLEAGAKLTGESMAIEDLKLEQALRWSLAEGARVQVVVEPDGDTYLCSIASRQSSGWVRHAAGRLVRSVAAAHHSASLNEKNLREQSVTDHYAGCTSVGLEYGGAFQSLARLRTGGQAAEVWVDLAMQATDGSRSSPWAFFHPAALDVCFQGIAGLVKDRPGLWLPTQIGHIRWLKTGFRPIYGSTIKRRMSQPEMSQPERSTAVEEVRCDLEVFGRDNELIAVFDDMCLVCLESGASVKDTRGAATRASETPIPPGITVPTLEPAFPALDDATALTAYLRRRLAEIMDCPESDITLDIPLENLGLDSMMAFELIHDLEKNLGLKIPMERFLGGITLSEIADHAMRHSVKPAADASMDEWIEGAL